MVTTAGQVVKHVTTNVPMYNPKLRNLRVWNILTCCRVLNRRVVHFVRSFPSTAEMLWGAFLYPSGSYFFRTHTEVYAYG